MGSNSKCKVHFFTNKTQDSRVTLPKDSRCITEPLNSQLYSSIVPRTPVLYHCTVPHVPYPCTVPMYRTTVPYHCTVPLYHCTKLDVPKLEKYYTTNFALFTTNFALFTTNFALFTTSVLVHSTWYTVWYGTVVRYSGTVQWYGTLVHSIGTVQEHSTMLQWLTSSVHWNAKLFTYIDWQHPCSPSFLSTIEITQCIPCI